MKVLIIGLGSIAKKHIASLQKIEGIFEIYALRSSRTSKPYDGVTDLFDIDEVMAMSFDFAIISNPTAEHKSALELVADMNIPLFIEKPLYHTLDIKDIVEKIVRKGTLTYIACNLRFLPCIQFIKQYLSDNHIRVNEVNSYCGSYLPTWRPEQDYRKVYSSIPELGGGVHIDLIHEIDYLYWLFDKPKTVNKVFSHKSSLKIDAVDYANYCLEYDTFNVSLVLNYFRKDSKRSLEIVAEEGTFNVDLLTDSVTKGGELIFQSEERIIDTYPKQMAYFVSCMKGEKKSLNTIQEAYRVLLICL
ncbi:MAG: Gfo/Idh/MocA family oxidoreductase [Paludibacteraceae bacterium]|mgnify:CR=1 FL=1|nr:Gfo/Idh/MocA family oxidoreductase [Paludibacteraceae bacterium]HOU67667.1 Gfo/Idh/MocA family oxidoreductase [Paludibacteraceae bacterium]HQF49702.1 Gfo/Idh/MocA family oxidoreductase [Paludibacteraceae bacterium]